MNSELWFLKAKRLFRKKKMPHDVIAKEFGVTPSAISLKLRGERESTWNDIVLFAELLNVTPLSLVADDPNLPETVMQELILSEVKELSDEHQQAILSVAKSFNKK